MQLCPEQVHWSTATATLEEQGRGYRLPNGGVYASAQDLGRYIGMLSGKRAASGADTSLGLSPSSLAAMWAAANGKPGTPDPVSGAVDTTAQLAGVVVSYGLGLFCTDQGIACEPLIGPLQFHCSVLVQRRVLCDVENVMYMYAPIRIYRSVSINQSTQSGHLINLLKIVRMYLQTTPARHRASRHSWGSMCPAAGGLSSCALALAKQRWTWYRVSRQSSWRRRRRRRPTMTAALCGN